MNDRPSALSGRQALVVTAEADAPMRLSVQLRDADAEAARGDRRWERSVYVDAAPRTFAIPVSPAF